LRLAVEPKSKKVIDLWNEGEHNLLLAIEENDWLHGEQSFTERKKVVDFESQGEHNRSSRLKKNDWLPRRNKSFARRKKVVDFESKRSINAPRALRKTTDGRREKLSRNEKKLLT